MASIQRARSFIRRIRPRPQFATAARSSPLNDSSASFLSTVGLCQRGSNSSASKHHWGLKSGLMLAGPTAVFVCFGVNTAYAETASDAEPIAANEHGEAYVTGLRRIEDGSVVSNSHTIKWRIFTDKGRELFLKGKIDEAEKFLRSAIDEAKEGFGPRDPHVASSYNNLVAQSFGELRK